MIPILSLFLLLGGPSAEPPWSELSLSIEREAGVSSEHVTLCRVRVVNHGRRSWPGRTLHFEARAIEAGAVAERARGRFGLTLAPYGRLETLIGFDGSYQYFEVGPADPPGKSGERRGRRGGSRSKRRRH